MMKYGLLLLSLLFSGLAFSQDEQEAAPETPAAEEKKPKDKAEIVLQEWLENEPAPPKGFPRRWLILQAQGIAGAPSPLLFDRPAFESYGWLEADEGEAVSLFFQINPKARAVPEGEELLARLQTFLQLSSCDGIALKNSDSTWSLYARVNRQVQEIAHLEKGPENLRQEGLVRWLTQQFGYDALVAGSKGGFLILAKMKAVRAGSQGLILKGTGSKTIVKDSKDVGALVKVVYESDDYLVAKVTLSKSGKSKAPLGSKVLFSE